jgi:hypothetical protein
LHCNGADHQVLARGLSEFRLASYTSFEEDSSEWQDQIVSSSRDEAGVTWVLLSNGDLIEAWADAERYGDRLEEQKRTKIGQPRGWIDGELYAFKGKLFLWEEEVVKQLLISDGLWTESVLPI